MLDIWSSFWPLVDTLKAHPRVELLEAAMFEGVEEDELRCVEQDLGYPLDPAIRRFYADSNGLQLRWIDKRDPRYDPEEHVYTDEVSPVFYEDFQTGAIHIMSLERVLFNDWEGVLYFDDWMTDDDKEVLDGIEYGLKSFRKMFQILDGFDSGGEMAFFLDGTSNPRLYLLDDHHNVVSKATHFEDYITFLMATFGISELRRHHYARREWGAEPPTPPASSYWTPETNIDLDVFFAAKDAALEAKD